MGNDKENSPPNAASFFGVRVSRFGTLRYPCGPARIEQVSTGHLHLDGFDSVFLTHKKRETLLRVSLFLVPATGIEPVRILLRGILSPLCLPIPPCRHRFVIVAQFSFFVKEKAVVIDYPGTNVPG